MGPIPWQELVTGIIVVLAAAYIGAKYLPESWRRAIVYRLSAGGQQSAPAKWLVKWLDISASCGTGSGSSKGGSCGSCGTCGTSKATEPAPPVESGKRAGKVIRIHERR